MPKHKQDALDRLLNSLSIRGFLLHPATLFVVATSLVIAGAIFAWESQKDKILALEEFRLTDAKIKITPPPVWADTNLKDELISQLQRDGQATSILDPELVPNTANAIKQIGFVQEVNQVKKSKTGLELDVAYRHPVGLVEISRQTVPNWPAAIAEKLALLPVDREGVVMPESVRERLGEASPLIKIMVPYPANFSSLESWKGWPDARIQDAAAIADLFESKRKPLGLAIINTSPRPRADKVRAPFELRFNSGGVIVWGNAPGKEAAGEATVEQKIAALNALLIQHGEIPNLGPGRFYDLRSGKLAIVNAGKTAQLGDLFRDIK